VPAELATNMALPFSKLKYLNEAGINGKMNESVFITKWILSPLTLARTISGGKSLFAIRISTSSSRLKVIVAIVTPYRILEKDLI
jgi:hypothetical protein